MGRMRSRVAGAAFLAVCAGALLTACGSQVALSTPGAAEATPEPLPTVTKTALDETAFGLELNTIDKMFGSSKAEVVVEGTVTAVVFEGGGHEPVTRMVVTVERARGTPAREVTVWESGGIVRASELWSPPPRPPKEGAVEDADPVPSAGTNQIIDMQPQWGAARAAVGDRVVMFLYLVDAEKTQQSFYILVGGTLGRFRYDEKSGEYFRAGEHKDWEPTLPLAVLDRELTPLP